MQFDGTSDTIHSVLRGRALLNTKLRAIEQCGLRDIGVILVPSLVPRREPSGCRCYYPPGRGEFPVGARGSYSSR
jgi:hypothetical protein